MPLPTPGDVHVSRFLTNIAIAFIQNPALFLGARVFPAVMVDKQADKYVIWDRADFNRDEAKPTGPTGEAPIGDLRMSSDSYDCVINKFAHLIDDPSVANSDSPIELRKTKTRDVARKLMIRREKDWVAKFFATGKWKGSSTGADLVGGVDFTQWDNFAASDPVSVIRKEIVNMETLGISAKNFKLTIGKKAWLKLVDHPKFIERFEQVQASIINEQLVAAVLGIGEVIVPGSVEATSLEAAATTTMDFIHGKRALLTYAPSAPALDEPSAGYTYVWAGLYGAQNSGVQIKEFRREEKSSDQIEGASAWDHKLTSDVCGVLFDQVVA